MDKFKAIVMIQRSTPGGLDTAVECQCILNTLRSGEVRTLNENASHALRTCARLNDPHAAAALSFAVKTVHLRKREVVVYLGNAVCSEDCDAVMHYREVLSGAGNLGFRATRCLKAPAMKVLQSMQGNGDACEWLALEPALDSVPDVADTPPERVTAADRLLMAHMRYSADHSDENRNAVHHAGVNLAMSCGLDVETFRSARYFHLEQPAHLMVPNEEAEYQAADMVHKCHAQLAQLIAADKQPVWPFDRPYHRMLDWVARVLNGCERVFGVGFNRFFPRILNAHCNVLSRPGAADGNLAVGHCDFCLGMSSTASQADPAEALGGLGRPEKPTWGPAVDRNHRPLSPSAGEAACAERQRLIQSCHEVQRAKPASSSWASLAVSQHSDAGGPTAGAPARPEAAGATMSSSRPSAATTTAHGEAVVEATSLTMRSAVAQSLLASGAPQAVADSMSAAAMEEVECAEMVGPRIARREGLIWKGAIILGRDTPSGLVIGAAMDRMADDNRQGAPGRRRTMEIAAPCPDLEVIRSELRIGRSDLMALSETSTGYRLVHTFAQPRGRRLGPRRANVPKHNDH